MVTPLTQLIEEQKKELHNILDLGGGGGSNIYNDRVEKTLHLLTIAITKGYELGVEDEKEREYHEFMSRN